MEAPVQCVSHKGRILYRHHQGQISLVMLQNQFPDEKEMKLARASHGLASHVCPGKVTWSIKAHSFLSGVGPVIVGNQCLVQDPSCSCIT